MGNGARNHLGQDIHEAAAARRESLGPHGRAVEDLVDGYTRAVEDDALSDYFGRLAAELLELRTARARLAEFESATTRIGIAAREARAKLADFVEVMDDFTQG